MLNIPEDCIIESDVQELELLARGKVRDVYAIDDNRLLIVASDRLSAYDVVLPDGIPGKGAILTAISNFWFAKTQHIIRNHLTGQDIADVVTDPHTCERLRSRATVVRRLKPLPIEAVVRGYLIGSGWKDYLENGSVCGIALPSGLKLAEQLKTPIFTPATKAEIGDHDENISFEQVCSLIGEELASRVRDTSLKLYNTAALFAREHGIVIADTKFEFGQDTSGELYLIDEALTPDSSRFWPVEEYRVGVSPPSFDKQYVRDYLETLDWGKSAPGPRLPTEVIAGTRRRYLQALEKLNTTDASG